MKDNSLIIIAFLITAFIFWQLVILFAFWGVDPKGSFSRINESEERIIKLEAQLKEMNSIVQTRSKNIEILKSQVEKKERKKYLKLKGSPVLKKIRPGR